jgi:hypothetical protein
LTVDTFVAAAAAAESRTSAWLVVGPGGQVVGVLGLDELRAVRGGERRSKRIGDLAVPTERWPWAYEDELVADVILRLEGSSTRAVVRGRGQDTAVVLGLLLPEDISRAVATGGAVEGRPGKARSHDGDAREDRVPS